MDHALHRGSTLIRLRFGVVLWVLSWVPYGLIFGLSGAWLTLAWTFEILLGLSGLALAGTEFARAVHDSGWTGAPRVVWRMLIHGQEPAEGAEKHQ